MFKKMRGIKLPYVQQGLIYFTCQNYGLSSAETQKQIYNTCIKCGTGDHSKALFEALTTQKPIRLIGTEHNVSESTLYRLRKEFYEEYDKRLKEERSISIEAAFEACGIARK